METILPSEAWRVAAFAGVFAVMALAEALLPRRDRVDTRTRRWFTNFSIVVIDALAVRVLFPMTAVGVALWADAAGFGLLNLAGLRGLAAGLIAFVLLDLAIYAQHVVSHKVPVLWRVHRMHHADRDLDASSGLRFHPVEIVLSMAFKLVVVALIGAPALAVFLFEVVLNGMAIFNHANFKIPPRVDAVLRLFVVTPDMHRVHHSIIRRETDANYGFNLALWDRLFGTYIAQPEKGHTGMTVGLPDQQTLKPSELGWSLAFPFMRDGKRTNSANEPIGKKAASNS